MNGPSGSSILPWIELVLELEASFEFPATVIELSPYAINLTFFLLENNYHPNLHNEIQ